MVGLGMLALNHPIVAAAVVTVCVVVIAVFAAWLVAAIRRRWRRSPGSVEAVGSGLKSGSR